MFQNNKAPSGDPHQREIDRLSKIVDHINSLKPGWKAHQRAAFRKTAEFRACLSTGELTTCS